MELDVNNFKNFTIDEYRDNLLRLGAPSHNSLVGKTVYYSQKSYGEHKVIKWDEDRGEFLLDLNGQKFWSNPFRIHIFDNTLPCPVLGKTYNYFDDGKIKPSRKLEVTITEIIPFNEIDEGTLNDWKQEVEDCHWLYAKETDYFVKGDLKVSDNKIAKIIFVRTVNNEDGWFSLGWWAGRLDIDGSLSANLNYD